MQSACEPYPSFSVASVAVGTYQPEKCAHPLASVAVEAIFYGVAAKVNLMDRLRFSGSLPLSFVASSFLPSPAAATLGHAEENIGGGGAGECRKARGRGERGSSFIILPLIYFTTELIKNRLTRCTPCRLGSGLAGDEKVARLLADRGEREQTGASRCFPPFSPNSYRFYPDVTEPDVDCLRSQS